MVTMYRRRKWREHHNRNPPSFDDLMKTDFYIGVHIGITGFFLAVLLLLLIFGDRFINLFAFL